MIKEGEGNNFNNEKYKKRNKTTRKFNIKI